MVKAKYPWESGNAEPITSGGYKIPDYTGIQSTPQDPISNYRSDEPPVMSNRSDSPPVSGNRSDGPPVQGNAIPNYVNPTIPNIAPVAPSANPTVAQAQSSQAAAPNYTGQETADELNKQRDALIASVNPNLNYGYNPAQWGINKRLEDMATQNEAGGNSYGYGMNRDSWLKSQQGYLPNLPNQDEYNAHQAKLLAPFNASVAREKAAGRPGHSGEVPATPNYTQPNIAPTAPIGTNPQIQPQAPGGNLPQIQQQAPQDRWLGTQRRQPSYF